jgi:hypothetical protein
MKFLYFFFWGGGGLDPFDSKKPDENPHPALYSLAGYLVTGTSWVGRGDAGDCEVMSSGICNRRKKVSLYYRIATLTSSPIIVTIELIFLFKILCF